MINLVSIKNFQSHKDTKLEFSEGVNVIIGKSDNGKSAIIKALSWAINNKPSGDDFRSHFAKDENTSVEIELDNQYVKRIKGKKDNLYEVIWDIEEAISNPHYEPEQYFSFNKEVPEDIAKLLNFSDINFHKQLDAPFMLSNSSGEVARFLNKIVNLDIIDKAQADIESKRRKTNTNINYKTEQLNKYQEDIKQYDNLDKIKNKIKILEVIEREYKELKKDYIGIVKLLEQLKEINEESKEHNKIVKYEKQVEELLLLEKDIHKNKKYYHDLTNILQKKKSIKTTIKQYEESVAKLEEDFEELFPNNCPLCGAERR